MTPSVALYWTCLSCLVWTFVGVALGLRITEVSNPFRLRDYQSRIADELDKQTGVILLPIGAGKTAIASELISRALKRLAASKVVVFVPTERLVMQQAVAISEYCGVSVARYYGGDRLPPAAFRVLVSTPEHFLLAQDRDEELLAWRRFSLAVFDEVHHAWKEPSYFKILHYLSRCNIAANISTPDSSSKPCIQIIGLTASLSYGGESIERKMVNLGIGRIVTASTEELLAAGYHASAAQEEHLAIQTLDLVSDAGDLDEALASEESHASHLQPLLAPKEHRESHWLVDVFLAHAARGTLLPFAAGLIQQVLELDHQASIAVESFRSPLKLSDLRMEDWGKNISSWRKAMSLEGADQHLFWALEQLYEALRLLIMSGGEDEEGSLVFLRMMLLNSKPSRCAGTNAILNVEDSPFLAAERPASFDVQLVSPSLATLIDEYDDPRFYVRMAAVKYTLLRKFRKHSTFRGIVQVQQPVTCYILQHFLLADPVFADVFCPLPLHATSAPAAASLSLSEARVRETLKSFEDGACNLLITTVVAEEIMDLPAASVVLRFDPSHGRARKNDSKYVVMDTGRGRDVESVSEAEQAQLYGAAPIALNKHQGFYDNWANSEDDDEEEEEEEEQAQLERERVAGEALADAFERGDFDSDVLMMDLLNRYAQKTDTELNESYNLTDEVFNCTLKCCSILGNTIGSGNATSKKEAKKKAAADLLNKLLKRDMS